MGGLPRFSAQPACGAAGNKLQQLVSDSATHNHECTRIVQMRHDGMKKIDVQRVRVRETPSLMDRGDTEAVPGRRGTVLHAADGKEPRRHGSARTARAPEAEMGTPVLVGAGRKGNQRRALVGAAVDLGLQFGSDGIQGLLEVGVVTTPMGLLEAFPG